MAGLSVVKAELPESAEDDDAEEEGAGPDEIEHDFCCPFCGGNEWARTRGETGFIVEVCRNTDCMQLDVWHLVMEAGE